MKNDLNEIGHQPSIDEYRSMRHKIIYRRQVDFNNKLDAELEDLILKLEMKKLEAHEFTNFQMTSKSD